MRRRPRTVFLSSTGRELSEHREIASAAIDDLDGWRCNKMERWASSPNAPIEEIHRHVERSNLFVGLVGHIQGSVPPDSAEQLSYTEQEYEFAAQLGKPCLMFVAKEGFPISAELRESDSRYERQLAFRAKVCREHTVKYFDNPYQLATNIVLSIVNWREQPLPKRDQPSRFQVPSSPAHFADRVHERPFVF